MRLKPGMRVGALTHSDETSVYFLGYGVYDGDFVPPDDLVFAGTTWGAMAEEEKGMCEELGVEFEPSSNPRITLDNGDVVWGCECWWDAEKNVQEALAKGTKPVVEIKIADYRQQGAELIARKSMSDQGIEHGDV